MPALSATYVHEVLRRDLGTSNWQVSEPLGSLGTTRMAQRGRVALVVKLVDTPLDIMKRLSELGATPQVITAGEHEGVPYMVQEVVTGPHPDHDWFGSNVAEWADMVRCYLDDVPLRQMLAAVPGRWRVSVDDAARFFDDTPAPRSAALQDPSFQAAFGHWQQQSETIVRLPLRPIHPDPHWNNYVIASGRPYLIDWEHIDLSDPMRDVGYQIWGFLRQRRWAEFLQRVGLSDAGNLEAAVYWWAGFKVLMNASWNDGQGDERGAAFHADLFRAAVERRAWVDQLS
ncbi:phosphotransferase family protein [Kribbella sp. CA-245084]|uniref:phosphotransferase family protein n=1 Tax=Kribbella sp. CA-245084 TaxID=3239940 RepID=UPI003D8B5BFF